MKIASFVFCLAGWLAFPALAAAQARPEFEVATVKIVAPGNNSESYMPTLDLRPGATLRIYNRRLDEIIMLAYDIGVKQISGPRWLIEPTSDPTTVTRFEVMAKIPEDARKEDIPLMLQKLLEDRFKLQVHREPQTTQVYALEVAKGGHKMQSSKETRPAGCARVIATSETTGAAADCVNVTMTQLAQQLQSLSPAYFRDGPIVDKTELTGTFDVHLEWFLLAQIEAGQNGPTMYAAVEKLGLTLQKKKETANMLVVDHCEQTPTEN